MKNTTLISRLVSFGLITVLFLLTGFSIWGTVITQQAADHARATAYLSDQYEQARFAVEAEESLERKYRLEPSPAVYLDHRAAAADLVTALKNVFRNGDANDRALVEQLLAAHNNYLVATTQMFAAVDTGNTAQVIKIDHTIVDPIFGLIQQQVDAQADAHRLEADQSLVELNQTQHMILIATPIVFALGLALLGVFWTVLRKYSRKIDESMQVEFARLGREALTDNLTELGNHRAYQEDVQCALEDGRHQGETVALALINVDEIKAINDERGHLQGDRILTELASVLREAYGSDCAYRLSGDQFAVILPRLTPVEAVSAMNRMCKEVERRLSGATVSIGVATTALEESTADMMYEQADAALHEAKRRGRNSAVSFENIREHTSILSSAKAQALRRLLAEPKITVAFQPIWDLKGGGLLSFEALTRPAAEYGFDGPQEAFDIAEKIGRAHELDHICLQAILARAVELPAKAMLFLNLSPQTLDHDLLTGAVLVEAVVAAGLTPDRVVLEITERSEARLDVVVREARRLRELGFKLALDDAGAGNAGLEMMSQMPVDFVKIDRAVVTNALADQAANAVLAGIITIARQMHAYVIAEGIENVEMLTFVQQVGAQGVQGYLLGRPSQIIASEKELQGLSPFALSH